MLNNYIYNIAQAETALITIITTYATVAGVIASIMTVIIAFRKMKKEHESKMASKDDVKVVDLRLGAYIDSHKELHKKESERINDMHRMLCVIYDKTNDMKSINKEIVDTAYSFLGQEEIRGNLGFKDEQFEELMKAVGWQKSQAWCAYFAELVWRKAYANQNSLIEEKLRKLFSAGAVATFNAFDKSPDFETTKEPVIGSVVIWQNHKNGVAKWSGHAGIVVKVRSNGIFESIEGNTNDDGSREGYEVALKPRKSNYGGKNGLIVKGFIVPKQP